MEKLQVIFGISLHLENFDSISCSFSIKSCESSHSSKNNCMFSIKSICGLQSMGEMLGLLEEAYKKNGG